MRIIELIEALKKFPPDTHVLVAPSEGCLVSELIPLKSCATYRMGKSVVLTAEDRQTTPSVCLSLPQMITDPTPGVGVSDMKITCREQD